MDHQPLRPLLNWYAFANPPLRSAIGVSSVGLSTHLYSCEVTSNPTPASGEPPTPSHMSAPGWIIGLATIDLVVLTTAGICYLHFQWLRNILPSSFGVISIGVPWWGALGGLTISLSGIVRYARNWNPQFNLWHLFRPVLGAIAGSVSVLIFVLLIHSTGARVSRSSATFFVLAFVVGYREEVFRTLLQEATDLLLAASRPRNAGRGSTPTGSD